MTTLGIVSVKFGTKCRVWMCENVESRERNTPKVVLFHLRAMYTFPQRNTRQGKQERTFQSYKTKVSKNAHTIYTMHTWSETARTSSHKLQGSFCHLFTYRRDPRRPRFQAPSFRKDVANVPDGVTSSEPNPLRDRSILARLFRKSSLGFERFLGRHIDIRRDKQMITKDDFR